MTYIYIQYSICTCNSVMSFYKHKSGAQKRDAAASTERFISKQLRINHTSGNLSDDGRIHFAGIYIYLRSHNIDSVFPNVTIALRICLTLMCTVATDERCFSYMKRVKNVLRTTMSQGRFADLATMTIERELLDEIDDKEIISSFVEQKIRKKSII